MKRPELIAPELEKPAPARLPFALVLLTAAIPLLAGCNASFGLRYGNTSAPSTQPSVGPGGSMTGGSVGVRIGDGPALGAAIGVGVLGVVLEGRPRKAAEPDASRSVHEQDCSQPLENPAANLRCK